MRIAVIAGGWHFPMHFYRELPNTLPGADLFVIAHRDPELPIVREEKADIIWRASGPLGDLDRELYASYPDVADLRKLGWRYREEPNTCGDWEFFNQWLDKNDFRQYDMILNCHDDTFIRPRRPGRRLIDALGSDALANQLLSEETLKSYPPWLLLSNGRYPEAPNGYVRGSFEFWKRELLELLGGRINLGNVNLTREGKTDSPAGLHALSAWNSTCVPLRDFMVKRGIANRITYLSPHYRVSPFAIEGERGFLHYQDGAPWSFEKGLAEYPLREGCMAASHRLGVAIA